MMQHQPFKDDYDNLLITENRFLLRELVLATDDVTFCFNDGNFIITNTLTAMYMIGMCKAAPYFTITSEFPTAEQMIGSYVHPVLLNAKDDFFGICQEICTYGHFYDDALMVLSPIFSSTMTSITIQHFSPDSKLQLDKFLGGKLTSLWNIKLDCRTIVQSDLYSIALQLQKQNYIRILMLEIHVGAFSLHKIKEIMTLLSSITKQTARITIFSDEPFNHAKYLFTDSHNFTTDAVLVGAFHADPNPDCTIYHVFDNSTSKTFKYGERLVTFGFAYSSALPSAIPSA